MKNDNGRISFSVGLDTSQLERDTRKAKKSFDDLGNSVVADCSRIDNSFGKIGRSLASLGAAWSLQEFARKVAQVRGEFQQLEVAMETMLGSKSKADALMAQMVQTAATTPFGLQEVAGGAKQLLAYGLEAEKVNDTLIRLGDIASGLSIPLGDLVYLYGTTMAQGRLYTQDLNQFTGRGIPMLKELAKQFGVAESAVKGLVEEGKVGFPEVRKVIESLTDEGGMFANLMEKQSKTITGRISNLEDSISTMFNEIGQKSEGVITGAIGFASALVENYETIGKVLLGLISVYGSYRAAVMLTVAAQRLAIAQRLASLKGITVKQLALRGLASAWRAVATAQNAYIALGAVAIYGAFQMATALNAEEAAAAAVARRMDELTEAQQNRTNEVNDYIAVIKDETKTATQQREAYNRLKEILPELADRYSIAEVKTIELADAQRILNQSLDTEKLARMREEVERYNAVIDGNRWDKLTSAWEDLDFWEFVKTTEAWSVLSNPTIGGLRMLLSGGLDEYAEAGKEAAEAQKEAYEETMEQAEWDKKPLEEKIKARSAEIIEIDTKIKLKKSRIANLDAVITDLQQQLNTISLTLTPEQKGLLRWELGRSLRERSQLSSDIEQHQAERNGKNAELEEYQSETKELETVAKRRKKAYDSMIVAEKAYRDALKDDSTTSDGEIAELKKQAEDAKKAYDKLIVKGTRSKGENPSQRRADIEKAEQDTANAIAQSSRARQEMERDLHFQEEQNRINLERDASKRKRAQMKLDHERELAQLEQQHISAVNAEKQRQKAVFDAQETEKKAADKNYIARNFTESDIDQTQIDNINARYATLTEQTVQLQKQSEADMIRSEFQAMQEHLKNYGSYQQQKLALAQEYAEKIRNAQSEGERLSLERERDSKLASIETSELKANMNWSAVFGEFGGMFEDMIRPVLEDAKKYTQTDEFKNADHASQQALIEAIRQMEQSLGGAGKVSFKKLGTEVKAYQKAMLDLRNAQDAYKATYTALTTAQEDYATAVQNGTKEEIARAKDALTAAQQNEAAAAQNVQAMQSVADEAQATMTQTATSLKTSMDGVVSGLQKIASGSASGAYYGLIELGDKAKEIGGKLGDAFGKVADKLKSVPIIGWIVSIIDIFKDGLSIVVGGILDAVFNAVSGIIGDILSGDLFVTIGESLLQGIGKILDSFTWGGFSSWFGAGGNAKEVAETINRLSDRNELLCVAIETLTDEIKASRGTKSVEAYQRAVELQEETNQNYLRIAQAQAGYTNSHHSWNYYWNGFTSEEITRISRQIGRAWDGSLWSLSPEEMEILRSNVDIWERIQNSGKGGYGERLTNELDNYIEQAGKLEELREQLYESLTGISFDSMYDSFIDNLMDMKYSAKDAAEDISEYFTRAMLENKVGELMEERLKGWWERFAEAMEDNDLTQRERDKLLDEYLGYLHEADAWRDAIFAATGYDSGDSSSQDSTKKGFATASQDSVDELNGRFTAVQMATERIKELNETMTGAVMGMRIDTTMIRQHADELRGLSLMAVNHLADISRNTFQLYEISNRLERIEKNTRNI